MFSQLLFCGLGSPTVNPLLHSCVGGRGRSSTLGVKLVGPSLWCRVQGLDFAHPKGPKYLYSRI